VSATVLIEGLEALPIRAIPYVTGWLMTPDMIVKGLAKTGDRIQRLKEVTAYHLAPDGNYASILPKEWDGIEAEIKILTHKLNANESFDQELETKWRNLSILALPPGCFVWKEDFEKSFLQTYSSQKFILVDERPGDRELNFSPFISPEFISIVMEGFRGEDVLEEEAKFEEHDEEARPERLRRSKLQLEVILAVIKSLGFDPLSIPDGGKAKIKLICLTCSSLFTHSGFDHAWKKGLKANLFRMSSHDKYLS
jgi:hypothetical protein